MKKQKQEEKINRLERQAYRLPLALRIAAEKAKKEQPELIAVSGKIRYVHLD